MSVIKLYGTMRTDSPLPPKIPDSVDMSTMTFAEIEKLIWSGIGTTTYVSLRDRFSDDALIKLINQPCADQFPRSFKYWLWDALDNIFNEQENAA